MREIRQSGSEGGEVMSLPDPYEGVCDPCRGRKNSYIWFRWSTLLRSFDTPATLFDPCGITILLPNNS